jgi:hypothetical protein
VGGLAESGMQTLEEWLARKISDRTRIVILGAICLIPILFVARQFSPGHGFTRLLEVGRVSLPRALPEFQALNPITFPGKGYDGQFYAQVAIDPLLKSPRLVTALDDAEYRSRRIAMPALSWLLGVGEPARVVTCYTLINFVAWFCLLGLILKSVQPQTAQAWMCVGATMWSSGVFASLQRSLTDLPAATALVAAGTLTGRSAGTALLALSLLTKETYAVCVWLPFANLSGKTDSVWQRITTLAAIILPLLLWLIYVHSRLKTDAYTTGDVSWPFEGWIYGLLFLVKHKKAYAVIAALSLVVQLIYLGWRPQYTSFYWCIAVSFALASCLMGDDPFTSDVSFTRDLLPVTVGFNALLIKESPRKFCYWFLAGNIGLASGVVAAIGKIV